MLRFNQNVVNCNKLIKWKCIVEQDICFRLSLFSWHLLSQGSVATRLRYGGIFSDYSFTSESDGENIENRLSLGKVTGRSRVPVCLFTVQLLLLTLLLLIWQHINMTAQTVYSMAKVHIKTLGRRNDRIQSHRKQLQINTHELPVW